MDHIQGQPGVKVSAYSLVDALHAALEKSSNNLRVVRPMLQNLQTITISRRGERETPALTTLEQVHAPCSPWSHHNGGATASSVKSPLSNTGVLSGQIG